MITSKCIWHVVIAKVFIYFDNLWDYSWVNDILTKKVQPVRRTTIHNQWLLFAHGFHFFPIISHNSYDIAPKLFLSLLHEIFGNRTTICCCFLVAATINWGYEVCIVTRVDTTGNDWGIVAITPAILNQRDLLVLEFCSSFLVDFFKYSIKKIVCQLFSLLGAVYPGRNHLFELQLVSHIKRHVAGIKISGNLHIKKVLLVASCDHCEVLYVSLWQSLQPFRRWLQKIVGLHILLAWDGCCFWSCCCLQCRWFLKIDI